MANMGKDIDQHRAPVGPQELPYKHVKEGLFELECDRQEREERMQLHMPTPELDVAEYERRWEIREKATRTSGGVGTATVHRGDVIVPKKE